MIGIMRRGAMNTEALNIYNEIENWSIEAKKENKDYFYYFDELNSILSGKKSFVVGRKGSGKTSIAQYLVEQEHADIFCVKLTFKNFPFNILYQLQNTNEYTSPNQYISIWKYLIFSTICQKMSTNNHIEATIKSKLEKLYGSSADKSLKDLISHWTTSDFGIEILGCGFNFGGEKNSNPHDWVQTSVILEKIVKEYCDNSKYYIIFDELDEDYKDCNNKIESEKYQCMLTSLFKAALDVREIFDRAEKNIYPVVFLRSDIYSQLKDSDKNKWREELIDLVWDRTKLKNMLKHRLSVALKLNENLNFQEVWEKLFSVEPVRMGNRGKKEMGIYEYMERSTEMRPRDFVQYIKECVVIAKSRNQYPILPQTVKDADEHFSNYLKGETIDELYPVLPEIEEILGLLSTIRKQNFTFETFEAAYNQLISQGGIQKRNVKNILLLLFDAGVIGNNPQMKGKAIFRFSQVTIPRFNFNESMIIHRGLYKSLQIF